jgi:fucose 4-O-acetylase-like acetyltransferase
MLVALGLAIFPIALCPWLSPLGEHAPLRYLAALFVDVPGVTSMPFVPLASWTAIGVLVALAMRRTKTAGAAGASIGFLASLAAVSIVIAVAAFVAMHAMLGADTLTRAHPAVWMNAIDLAARGACVLAVGALLSLVIPERARGVIVRLGRGSLIAYALHLPFVYGRFGESLRGTLHPAAATAIALGLIALAWLVIRARDEVVGRWRRRAL